MDSERREEVGCCRDWHLMVEDGMSLLGLHGYGSLALFLYDRRRVERCSDDTCCQLLGEESRDDET